MNEIFNQLVEDAIASKEVITEFCSNKLKIESGDNGIDITYGDESLFLDQNGIKDLLKLLNSVKYRKIWTEEELADEIYYNHIERAWNELPSIIKEKKIGPCIEGLDELICEIEGIEYANYPESNDSWKMSQKVLTILENKYNLVTNIYDRGYRSSVLSAVLYNIQYSMSTNYNTANSLRNRSAVLSYMNKNQNKYSYENHWIGKFIPSSGESSIMSAEIVSTCNYILYRWFNDGDSCLYYEDANLIPMSNLVLYLDTLSNKDKSELLYYMNEAKIEIYKDYVKNYSSPYQNVGVDLWKKYMESKDENIFDGSNLGIIDELCDTVLDDISIILIAMHKLLDNDRTYLADREVIDLRTHSTFNKLARNVY